MKKLMTQREVQAMWQGLQAITTDETPRKFAFAIARNRSKLRRLVEDIAETIKPLEEFEEKRIALAQEMAKKDPDGTPIMLPNNGGYFVPDMGTFTRKLEEIKRETGQDARDKEVEKILDSKDEIDIYSVPFDLLPETIRPDIMEALLPMVIEPTEASVTPIRDTSGSAR